VVCVLAEQPMHQILVPKIVPELIVLKVKVVVYTVKVLMDLEMMNAVVVVELVFIISKSIRTFTV
jgi:hypothetical protein